MKFFEYLSKENQYKVYDILYRKYNIDRVEVDAVVRTKDWIHIPKKHVQVIFTEVKILYLSTLLSQSNIDCIGNTLGLYTISSIVSNDSVFFDIVRLTEDYVKGLTSDIDLQILLYKYGNTELYRKIHESPDKIHLLEEFYDRYGTTEQYYANTIIEGLIRIVVFQCISIASGRKILERLTPYISSIKDTSDITLKKVVFQCISIASGRKILERLTPYISSIKDTSDITLKKVGLSMNKIKAIRGIVEYFENNVLDIGLTSSDDIIRRLSTIKGIGPWTIKTYLINTEGRKNIIYSDDLWVRKGVQIEAGLASIPSIGTTNKYIADRVKDSRHYTQVSLYYYTLGQGLPINKDNQEGEGCSKEAPSTRPTLFTL